MKKKTMNQNDSNDFITVGTNKARKRSHNRDQMNENLTQRTNTLSNKNRNQNKYTVPLEHLHRAVTHNLPCYGISFEQTEKLASAITVAEELYEHFDCKQVKLNNSFSVARFFGNQLKIGVKNKEDYQALCNQNVWPPSIQNKQISVILPKFTPE